MTPEAQRIAIAEFDGWTQLRSIGSVFAGAFTGKKGESRAMMVVPDYLSELNAIHEVEKKLNTDELSNAYERQLEKVCVGFTSRATPEQRAEALLRTIGKWTE